MSQMIEDLPVIRCHVIRKDKSIGHYFKLPMKPRWQAINKHEVVSEKMKTPSACVDWLMANRKTKPEVTTDENDEPDEKPDKPKIESRNGKSKPKQKEKE